MSERCLTAVASGQRRRIASRNQDLLMRLYFASIEYQDGGLSSEILLGSSVEWHS